MKNGRLWRYDMGNRPLNRDAIDYTLRKRIKRQTLIEDVCIFLAGVGLLGLLAYCLFCLLCILLTNILAF